MTGMTEAATTELRGLALLDAGIAAIEADPASWEQGVYRCRTGMCLFGHMAVIAGGQWLHPVPQGFDDDLLIATPEDGEDDPWPYDDDDDRLVIECEDRVTRLLGFGTEDAWQLAKPDNSLADIKRTRDEIAAGLAGDQS